MYLLFLLAWIIFNGNITLEIFSFGVVIAGTMLAFMSKFMDYSLKKELNVYRKSIWFFAYIVLLIREIVKANLAIIPRILLLKLCYRLEIECRISRSRTRTVIL